MIPAKAKIEALPALELVEALFRSLGTEPPGAPENDTLSEDELVAVWSSYLV